MVNLHLKLANDDENNKEENVFSNSISMCTPPASFTKMMINKTGQKQQQE